MHILSNIVCKFYVSSCLLKKPTREFKNKTPCTCLKNDLTLSIIFMSVYVRIYVVVLFKSANYSKKWFFFFVCADLNTNKYLLINFYWTDNSSSWNQAKYEFLSFNIIQYSFGFADKTRHKYGVFNSSIWWPIMFHFTAHLSIHFTLM